MKQNRKRAVKILLVILSTVLVLTTSGCILGPESGYANVRNVDLYIPEGQPPSNLTEIQVIPYIDAYYKKMENVELQISAKSAGTDIIANEKIIQIGNLTPEKTRKETVSMVLENGRGYDVWVTVWAEGRMQVSGNVNVYLPDRTVLPQKLARSMLAVSSIDIMTPDIQKDPIALNIIAVINNNGALESGNISIKVKMLNLQTGITASRESKETGSIAGNSAIDSSLSVTVPNKFDYSVEIQLYEDGAMFSTSYGRITLAPPAQYILSNGQIISIPETKSTPPFPMVTPTALPIATPYYEGEAKIGQFQIKSGGQPESRPAPGFTDAFAIAGLLGAALIIYWKKRRE